MEGLGWIKLRLKLDSVLVVKAAEFPRQINPLEISGLNPGGVWEYFGNQTAAQ